MIWMITEALVACGAYLVGAIPTGYLVAKLAGIADIRNYGSGNIGGTNVARVLGIQFFFLIVFIDAIKAFCYLRYAQRIYSHDKYLCAIALLLLLGNIFPIFLGFRGGKGVATSVGIVAALMPELWGYVFGVWLTILAITRTVGIASVIGALSMPGIACYQYGITHAYGQLAIVIAGSLVLTHRENIARFVTTLFA